MPLRQFFLVNKLMFPNSPKAVNSRDGRRVRSSANKLNLSGSSESRPFNETPSGTPEAFYGMLTRSSLLSASQTDTSRYDTLKLTPCLGLDSNVGLSQGQLISTKSLESSQNTLHDANSADLFTMTQRAIVNLTLENEELREHIEILSIALQNSTLLLDKKEQLIQERESFIRELAARLLLDRQRQS